MAHEFVSGVIAERKSWHGLEDFSEELLTSAEAAVRSGLDGSVERVPVFGRTVDGTEIADPGRNLIVWSKDNSIVGRDKSDDFFLVQPASLFETGERIFGDGQARISSALRLRGGSVITVNYKLTPEAVADARGADVELGEELEWFLSLSASYDGSLGYVGAVTGTRVVCMNTLVAGIGSAQRSWKVKLTSGAAGQIAMAEQSMENVLAYTRAFEAIAVKLRDAALTPGQFDAFAEAMYPTRDKLPAVRTADKAAGLRQMALKESWRTSDTIADVRLTGYGAWNAAGEFDEWLQPSRKSARSDADRFMDDFVFGGDSAKFQTSALEYLSKTLLGGKPAALVN